MRIDPSVDAVFLYLKGVVLATGTQLLVLLGPGILLGFLMSQLSGFVVRGAAGTMGFRPYYLAFGWIGTIVHEAGHAIFHLIFGHRILSIKWFDIHARDGSLGSVLFAYDHESLYQRIGLFFAGVGPLILGSLVMYYLSRSIIGPDVFSSMDRLAINGPSFMSFEQVSAMGSQALAVVQQVLTWAWGNLTNWKFYVFCYLAFCVGSSIQLSRADLKCAWNGFLVLLGLLLLFNLTTLWIGGFATRFCLRFSTMYGVFFAVMLFAIVMNVLAAGIMLLLPATVRTVKQTAERSAQRRGHF